MRLMIVDDSQFIRSTLRKIISERGDVFILEAGSAEDAKIKYAEFHPNVVFLDIMMVKPDGGLDAIKGIRKINNEAKIVVLTSLDENNALVKEAFELGASGYIKKPFSRRQIFEYLA